MRRDEKTQLHWFYLEGSGTHSVHWEVRFQQLVEYKRVHGNCNVPCTYNANPQLGNWVNNQRAKKETMSEERRKSWTPLVLSGRVGNSHFCSLGSPLSATCGVQTSSRKLQRTTGVQSKSATRDLGQQPTNKEGDNE